MSDRPARRNKRGYAPGYGPELRCLNAMGDDVEFAARRWASKYITSDFDRLDEMTQWRIVRYFAYCVTEQFMRIASQSRGTRTKHSR